MVDFAGLVSPGRQPEISANLSGLAEACRIVDRGDERERHDRADARDGHETAREGTFPGQGHQFILDGSAFAADRFMELVECNQQEGGAAEVSQLV